MKIGDQCNKMLLFAISLRGYNSLIQSVIMFYTSAGLGVDATNGGTAKFLPFCDADDDVVTAFDNDDVFEVDFDEVLDEDDVAGPGGGDLGPIL